MLTRALGTTPVCATSRGRTAAGRQTRTVNVKHFCVRKLQATAEDEENKAVSEDMLARLRAAEEEAELLRMKLAELSAASSSAGLQGADEGKPSTARIDSGDLRRETLFSAETTPRNWLSESDVSFFIGGGGSPGESTSNELRVEEQEIVARRLLLGLLATAGLGAFAMVPTQSLRLDRQRKPLFFYLVPLLRSQQLLQEAEQLVAKGSSAAPLLERILDPPNSLQQNLRDAAAGLPTPREVARAEAIGRDVFEYVEAINYDRYFESMRGAPRDSAVLARYNQFSLSAARAAQEKLSTFLALFPPDQREAATMQLNSVPR